MDTESSSGIIYLAKAKVVCPDGQILRAINFKPLSTRAFLYVYECVFIKGKLEYEKVINQWSDYKGKSPGLGDVNLLEQQSLDCTGNGFLTSFTMQIDLDNEQLRYVYKCGKFINTEYHYVCEARQTQEHDAESFHLSTLEHHGIKCKNEEILSWFQLEQEGNSLKYNFECCRPPAAGNFYKKM